MSEEIVPENQTTQETPIVAGAGLSEQKGIISLIKDPELVKSPSLAKFNDVDGLAKSYIELEKFRGNSVQIPKDDNPEAWAKFYAKLGVPDSPDKYEIEEKEWNGMKFGKENYKNYFEKAKEIGLTPKQVKELADYDFKRQTEAHDRLTKQQQEVEKNTFEALKKEFDDYEKVENQIKSTFNKFTNEENGVKLVEGLRKNPEFFKIMAEISSQFAEDSTEGIVNSMQKGQSQEEAKAEYDKMLSDKASPLHNPSHPDYMKYQDKHMALFKKFNNIRG
jgi:hypothetical protein